MCPRAANRMFQWPESGERKHCVIERTIENIDEFRSGDWYSKTCSPASTLSLQKTRFSGSAACDPMALVIIKEES